MVRLIRVCVCACVCGGGGGGGMLCGCGCACVCRMEEGGERESVCVMINVSVFPQCLVMCLQHCGTNWQNCSGTSENLHPTSSTGEREESIEVTVRCATVCGWYTCIYLCMIQLMWPRPTAHIYMYMYIIIIHAYIHVYKMYIIHVRLSI